MQLYFTMTGWRFRTDAAQATGKHFPEIDRIIRSEMDRCFPVRAAYGFDSTYRQVVVPLGDDATH
jgi:hypothetical protein